MSMMSLRRKIVQYLIPLFSKRGKYSRVYTNIGEDTDNNIKEELTIKVYEQRLPDKIDDKYANSPYIVVNAARDSEQANPSEPFENTIDFAISVIIPHSQDYDVAFDDDLRIESLAIDIRRALKDCGFIKFPDGTQIITDYGTSVYGTQALAAEIKFSAQIGGTTNKEVSSLIGR